MRWSGLGPVPHAPEISLHVAEEATELWRRTEEELDSSASRHRSGRSHEPAARRLRAISWTIPKPSGTAGSSTLHPVSGLVAIAASLPGAAEVHACDIDRFAIVAIGINAAANRSAWLPSKTDLVGRDEGRDAVLAGEVC